MVAVEGRFSFAADSPQLRCAAFLVAEPDQLITVDLERVHIDCSAGDFVTVNARGGVVEPKSSWRGESELIHRNV